MPLAERIANQVRASASAHLPPPVRAYAEQTLDELLAPLPAVGYVDALTQPESPESDDVLSRISRLSIVAHESAGHRDPNRPPDRPCGCAVAAAALGAAATWDAPASLIVWAVALGSELQLRLVQVLGSGHRDVGWDTRGTAGPPAAALAAAVVARVEPERMAHAIGIATSLTLGHGAAARSDIGALHVGKAATNGLLAAALAAHGSTAATTALEGPRGYLHVLGSDLPADSLADGLGQRWLVDTALDDGGSGSPSGGRRAATGPAADLRAASTDRQARLLARQLLDLPAEDVA